MKLTKLADKHSRYLTKGDLLNKVVVLLELIADKLFSLIGAVFLKIFPKKIKVKKIQKKKKIKIKTIDKLKDLALQTKKRAAENSHKISKKIKITADKAKQFDYKNHDYKKSFALFITIVGGPLILAKKWYLSLKPMTLVGLISSSAFMALAITGIYTSSKNISEKVDKIEEAREIASVKKVTASSVEKELKMLKKRPEYYKIDNKSFKVSDLYIPVYIEGSYSIKTLIFDVTLRGSNQYIKQYFKTHETLLRDKLATTIESITPQFLLTIEGKIIIKDKIKKELNDLLSTLKIKGKIKQIYINSLIAS